MGCGASTGAPTAHRAPASTGSEATTGSEVMLSRPARKVVEQKEQPERRPAPSPTLVRQTSGKRAKEPRKERAKDKVDEEERPADTPALLALQEKSGVSSAMERSDALVAAAADRWQQHQLQNEESRARYVEPQAVFDALESDDVAVVSLHWLITHAASGLPLPRRQDMPEEARVSVYTLKLWHGAAPEHVRKAVLPLISISYCWLTPEQ